MAMSFQLLGRERATWAPRRSARSARPDNTRRTAGARRRPFSSRVTSVSGSALRVGGSDAASGDVGGRYPAAGLIRTAPITSSIASRPGGTVSRLPPRGLCRARPSDAPPPRREWSAGAWAGEGEAAWSCGPTMPPNQAGVKPKASPECSAPLPRRRGGPSFPAR